MRRWSDAIRILTKMAGMKKTMDHNMSKILIIGATSAIAQATAQAWVTPETEFFLIARNITRLQQLADDLKVRGAKTVAWTQADLNQFDQHPALIKQAIQQLGSLDTVLIAHGSLDDQTTCEQQFNATLHALNTNLLSVISLLTPLAHFFETQRYGCIAVISSVAGDRGRQSNYIYGTAKGGLSIFLQGLRNRLQAANVNVLTIKPGFVDTPMTAHIQPKGALWAKPEAIAAGIVKAVEKRRNVVYLPRIWWLIMHIIKSIPESVFKRLKL